MSPIKPLLFSLLLIILLPGPDGKAQGTCNIEIKSQVTPTQKGRSTGEIQIIIEGDKQDAKRYKIFLLNQGIERATEELSERKVSKLKAGYYEFIVIDTKGDKCFKELKVQVQEAN